MCASLTAGYEQADLAAEFMAARQPSIESAIIQL